MRNSELHSQELIKYFLLLLLLLAFIPKATFSDSAPPEPKTIDELILDASIKYDVPVHLISYIVDHEDPTHDPLKQSDYIYHFSNPKLGIVKGERERSFGVVQINLDFNPDISYASSTDPIFSIDYLGSELSKGHCKKWSTCPL